MGRLGQALALLLLLLLSRQELYYPITKDIGIFILNSYMFSWWALQFQVILAKSPLSSAIYLNQRVSDCCNTSSSSQLMSKLSIDWGLKIVVWCKSCSSSFFSLIRFFWFIAGPLIFCSLKDWLCGSIGMKTGQFSWAHRHGHDLLDRDLDPNPNPGLECECPLLLILTHCSRCPIHRPSPYQVNFIYCWLQYWFGPKPKLIWGM